MVPLIFQGEARTAPSRSRPGTEHRGTIQSVFTFIVGQDGILRAIGNRPFHRPGRLPIGRRFPICPTAKVKVLYTVPFRAATVRERSGGHSRRAGTGSVRIARTAG